MSKQMEKAKAVIDSLCESLDHLHSSVIEGGINGIGIGLKDVNSKQIGIVVLVESSQDVFDKIPDTWEGVPVFKRMTGKIKAL